MVNRSLDSVQLQALDLPSKLKTLLDEEFQFLIEPVINRLAQYEATQQQPVTSLVQWLTNHLLNEGYNIENPITRKAMEAFYNTHPAVRNDESTVQIFS